MRTMLPPNITVRRLMAEGDGKETTPWHRLTAEQKAALDRDVDILRQAIKRAEEEQDLVVSFGASLAENSEAATVEECACSGCSAVAAMLELIKRAAERVEAPTPPGARRSAYGPVLYATVPVNGLPAPMSSEEHARLKKAVQEGLDEWVAAGRPLEVITEPEPAGDVWAFTLPPFSLTDLDDLLGRPGRPLEAQWPDFWTRKPPFTPNV